MYPRRRMAVRGTNNRLPLRGNLSVYEDLNQGSYSRGGIERYLEGRLTGMYFHSFETC